MNRDELLKLSKEEIIDLLLAIIQQQADKIAVLEACLNQNSKNSSKPPSSDGLKKPKSLRQPSGKKAGGQPGHEGNGPRLMKEPDQHVDHKPQECLHCPRGTCYAKQSIQETRYEIDINVSTVTTAHHAIRIKCPHSNEILIGRFPPGINSTIQYGLNLEALAVSLNTIGMVSVNRTHEILNDVFGVPISTGTISAMVSNCADKVARTVNEIKEAIITEPIIHVDETGIRVDKQTVWAHVASTDNLTYIAVEESRGKRGMDAIGVLLGYLGTAIHDCWASYFLYTAIRHGLCNAHLLRELVAVLENAKQIWAQALIDLLLEMKGIKEKLLSQNQQSPTPDSVRIYSLAYDKILAEALAHNPVPSTG